MVHRRGKVWEMPLLFRIGRSYPEGDFGGVKTDSGGKSISGGAKSNSGEAKSFSEAETISGEAKSVSGARTISGEAKTVFRPTFSNQGGNFEHLLF
jgi:hypothetical protein